MGYKVNEDGSVTRHGEGKNLTCHHCGATDISVGSKFCPHCGAELGADNSATRRPMQNTPSRSIDPKKKKITLIVLVAIVFFIGFLVVACGVYDNDPTFMIICDVILTAFLTWMLYMDT